MSLALEVAAMTLTAKLVRVAALVAAATGAAGCSAASSGGCTIGPGPSSATITSAQACQMIEENGIQVDSFGAICQQVCSTQRYCMLPASYVSQAQALNPDAGASPDGGPPPIRCPTAPATLTVTCVVQGCP